MKNLNIEENNNIEITIEKKSSEPYCTGDINNNSNKEKIKELNLSDYPLKSTNNITNDNTDMTFLSKLSSISEKKRKIEIKEELKRKKGNPNIENMNDNDKNNINKYDEREKEITNENNKKEQKNKEFFKLDIVINKSCSKTYNEIEKDDDIVNTEIRETKENENKNETKESNKNELIKYNLNNIVTNNTNEEDAMEENTKKDNKLIENNIKEGSIINNNINKNEVIKDSIKKDENIKEVLQNFTSDKTKLKDNTNERENFKKIDNDKNKIEYSQFEIDNKENAGNLKYFHDYNKKYRSKKNVTFSMKYKDSCVSLSNDRLTCYGDKGWSSVFVNSGADVGKWYYEVKIEEPLQNLNFLGYKDKVIKVNSYIRVGFACRYMRYDYPIGTDKYSYCVNSKNGKIFNNSISHECMGPIKVGDIIGCYLNLKNKNTYKFDPRSDKKLYEYLQNGILCDPKNPPTLKKNFGSYIFFSLNGQIKKNSFVDIYEGFYHPSVSLYMGACAKINLGPHFTYNYLKDYNPCMLMEQPNIL
ncbi:SPRY domain, putative [Plasmodium relictum]|uniref:SPRY domain, putative n=1 Tax=Plasmodium relictum TaxID=85471 RepID=A0A1J1HCN0_PLARL|nr:SPRY domain, putative [Plasmodium relictum]CRH03728.1 SPRY domain, putative [Plasmodium relictum]